MADEEEPVEGGEEEEAAAPEGEAEGEGEGEGEAEGEGEGGGDEGGGEEEGAAGDQPKGKKEGDDEEEMGSEEDSDLEGEESSEAIAMALSEQPCSDDRILEELLHASNMAYQRAAKIDEIKAAIKDWERSKTKEGEKPPGEILRKREDLLQQLREFDSIARKIDRLCALTDKYSSEDFLPRIKRESIAAAVGKRLSELLDMMEKELLMAPEHTCCAYCSQEATLPKVVVCGPKDHVPMIVFCDPGGKKLGQPKGCEPGLCTKGGDVKIQVPKGPQFATRKECQ
ncbi:hypothetical protein R5R35_005652 [Gryllus longicercus]|uniref:Uncharacterized protein n=1 Tax=Gryllus longicercus TaxID=2509291 RepID=A0AAN9VGR4_9ORTH